MMKKLTAEKCRELISNLHRGRNLRLISTREERYLEALEIALPALEQQEGTTKQLECPFPCGWKELLRISMSDGAFLARDLIEGEEVKDIHRHAVFNNTERLVRVLTAILNTQEKGADLISTPQHVLDEKFNEHFGVQPQTTASTATQVEGDGWIEWGGGDSPFKDDELKIIEVKFSSGDIVKDYAGIWWWGRCGDEDDIIAYRVIEHQERERGEEE